MPLYIDMHIAPGITLEEVEEAHMADVKVQERYDADYIKWWCNPQSGRVFCLVRAPSRDAAETVHREAHGMVANQIIELDEDTMRQFLLDGEHVSPYGAALLSGKADSQPDGGFRTILFTDMEGSTSLTLRLGDAGALAVLRTHDAIIREALTQCKGREVKHTGDGFMAAFVSASHAVNCAIEIQRAFAHHNEAHDETPIHVRSGISAGEPVQNSEDLFGVAVQLAARTCACAEPGQILVSPVIPELCVGKRFTFVDLGDTELKGFEHPIRLHEVRW